MKNKNNSLIKYYKFLGFEFDNYDLKILFTLFFGILFIIFILLVPKSYALSNFDTSYIINVPQITKLDTDYIDNSNHTYTEFFENLQSLESNYYHLITRLYICSNYTPCGYGLYLLPNTQNFVSTATSGLNYSNYSVFALYWIQRPSDVSSSNTHHYGIQYTSNSDKPTNIYTSDTYTNFLSCYQNNQCTSSSWSNIQGTLRYDSIIFDNNSNFSIDYSNYYTGTNSIIYSSTIPIHLTNGGLTGSTYTPYFKNVNLNGVSYDTGDVIPTYRNLYFSDNISYENLEGVGNIYIGSIPKNNLNNFTATFTYNYSDENYVNSIDYKYLFFGRINHNTYYSYEPINCSSSVLSSTAIDITKKQATTTFFPYGLTCSSDLTSYDNIYIRIYNTYDVNTNSNILNLKGSVQSGYYKRLSDVRATSNSSYIYERFEDLDSSFSFMLSTQRDLDYAYYETDNKYIASVNVNRTTNKIGSLILNPISFGIQSNTNALIYNMSNYYSDNTDIDLFLNYNSILSFNSSDDSINGTYTYYSDSNTITNGNVKNNHLLVVSDSYDVSYYFNQVNEFISSMSLDVMNFSILTQSLYDNAPTFLQYFIFSVFILLCLYFLYLLIRK